jgi:NTE family protein
MQKIGLVFSGGGGKGPYQVGVWRAMEELGLAKDIMAVSGTSVGALNAALFAQKDLKNAEAAWLSMSPSDILHIDIPHIIKGLIKRGITAPLSLPSSLATLAMHGIFSRKGLLRIITDYLDEDEDKVKKTGMPCYACASKMPFFDAEYFSLQEHTQDSIENILLASSAIPVVFPIHKINGSIYYDGFLTDNIPVTPLIDEGCNIIISIMLSRSSLIPVDDYPNCKIIPIYPQEDPGGALNFNNIPEKMQKGYDDAMKILAPAFELMEINYQYSVELQNYKKQHQEFQSYQNDKKQIDLALELTKNNLQEEIDKW